VAEYSFVPMVALTWVCCVVNLGTNIVNRPSSPVVAEGAPYIGAPFGPVAVTRVPISTPA
jgi:hypothetical protein